MDKHRKLSTSISNEGFLYKLGQNLKLFPSKEEANKINSKNKIKEKFLCKINLKQDSYEIEMDEDNSSLNGDDNLSYEKMDIDNIPWIISKYVFENNRENGYKLHRGDIFKLGKYILKIKEIGFEEEDKRVIIERKKTMKLIKNKNISINNISQIPLNNNQQEEDYTSILNINNNMDNRIQDNENNLNINEINQNNNKNNESENGSNNENNIHIIDDENENNKNDEISNSNVSSSEPSKISSSNNKKNNNIVNNSSNSNNNINDNLNFASVVNVNQENSFLI